MAYRVTGTSMQKKAWDAKLREDSQAADPFMNLSGTYSQELKTVPDAHCVKVNSEKGEAERTIGLLKDLQGAGIEGRTRMPGNEEEQVIRNLTITANSWAHAVPVEMFGVDAHRTDYLSVVQKAQPQLSKWLKEKKGEKIRQALIEKFSYEQLADPTSKTLGLNSNFFLPGVGGVNYEPAINDYTANIVSAANNTSASTLNVEALDALIEEATANKYIEPVAMNGEMMYTYVISSRQKRLLMAPGTENYFELLKDGDVRGANNQRLQYKMYKYGCLMLVEDPRSPTMVVNGSNLEFGYQGAGGSDTRTRAAGNANFDVGMLLGRGAFYEYIAEDSHFEDEWANYNQDKGIGIFNTMGYTLGEFDDDTPTDDTIHNKSSIITPLRSQIYVAP